MCEAGFGVCVRLVLADMDEVIGREYHCVGNKYLFGNTQ